MLRDGPIPYAAHGLLEYAAAALLIVSPFLFSFDSGAAQGISVALGVLLLVIAATTDGPTGLVDQIPRSAHAVLDYALAALLVALPFLAGFSDETAPTALFIALGVVHLLVTIGTRFR